MAKEEFFQIKSDQQPLVYAYEHEGVPDHVGAIKVGYTTRTADVRIAEQNRKIKIEEAKANLEAEKLNAQAEIERAKGAAKAIEIENGSLTPTYIQYLWVRQQTNLNDKTVIYIPTEGNLPILEAGRNATNK